MIDEQTLVKVMHSKFGIDYPFGLPRKLSKEEYIFRCCAMMEELLEYVEAVFITNDMSIKAKIDMMKEALERRELICEPNLDQQFDALVDLSVFLMGACERQGFPFEKGFTEVMRANCNKELAGTAEKSKRGFARDLIKPEGWAPPNMKQFVYPHGLIILDGPDASGKTTLANAIAERFNGIVFHHAWSSELNERMGDYYRETLTKAYGIIRKGGLVIIDRLYLSEQIYASIFREQEKTKWRYEMHHIKWEVYQVAKEIICLPYSKEEYIKQFNNKVKDGREELYTDTDNMSLVYDGYLEVCEKGITSGTRKRYARFDILGHDLNDYVEDIGYSLNWGQANLVLP